MTEAQIVLKTIKKAIAKQKKAMIDSGSEPTWELFEGTLGWYQIKQKLIPEFQELYKELWEKT